MAENIKGSIKSLNIYHTDAYAIAVRNGFQGTVEEWLLSLKGHSPVKGVDYYTPDEINGVVDRVKQLIQTSPSRIGTVHLAADAWKNVEESENLFCQVVTIAGVTENSQVDLNPDVNQLAIFHNKDLAFVTENVDGVVTVYAIGQKPTNDYTIQVTITEVIE